MLSKNRTRNRLNTRKSRISHAGIYACFVIFACFAISLSVQAQSRRAKPVAQPTVTQKDFDQLKTQADQAREAGKLEEAIPLYRKAVTVRPSWVDGWWYLATLLYDRDQYAEAARAFKQTAALQPKAGAPLVMQGLCEFRLGDYDNSLKHLRQGGQIGIGDNQDLSRVMRYHEGVLMLLKGDFETAQAILRTLSYENLSYEDLIIAHGLAILRQPLLPSQITPDYRDRDLIRRAGFAAHLAAQKNMGDAQIEYERLVADFPKAANLQYAYGNFLLTQRNDEAAIEAFKKEIQNSPSHALARIQIAYIMVRNKEAAEGLKLAQEAVNLYPRLPLTHYILGRVLFDTGDNDKAIEELETARRLAPNEPRIHFALSRAYLKAGRKTEAEQSRETFARLNKLAERNGARGDVIDENTEKAKPEPR